MRTYTAQQHHVFPSALDHDASYMHLLLALSSPELCGFFAGTVPGFDPVGSLLKSSWLKEPSTQLKQLATDRSDAGFAPTRARGSVSQQAAAPSQVC